MRPAEDVKVKLIRSISWLEGAQKQAYLAGVRTSIAVAKKIVEADETYASSSVWRALLNVDKVSSGDLEALLLNMNQYLEGTKFTLDIFPDPDLVMDYQFRCAVIEVAGDLMQFYGDLGGGNITQEQRKSFFFSHLKQIEDLLKSL